MFGNPYYLQDLINIGDPKKLQDLLDIVEPRIRYIVCTSTTKSSTL